MKISTSINWSSKLRHFLQVTAFAMGIAVVQYAFAPGRPFWPPAVYSLMIATITWAIIDLGRHLFPSSAETGWPRGLQGLGLVAVAIVVGFFAGMAIAEALCTHVFRFYPPGGHAAAVAGADAGSSSLRSSILVSLLAGIAGTYYFYTINQAAYLQRKMAEARHQAAEARLKLLETQLEPHMLFNTLANLRALIGTDPPAAQRMLDRINDYLRATLAASRTTQHPLRAEFDRLRDYLELMQVRMGARLAYTLDLPDALASHPVPALLLQPLVENAIKHGLEPKIEGGHITVSAQRQDGQLHLQVSDSGVGLPHEAHLPPTGTAETVGTDGATAAGGFGLAQVRERLATAYGAAASLQWGAAPGGGARAIIRMPLQE